MDEDRDPNPRSPAGEPAFRKAFLKKIKAASEFICRCLCILAAVSFIEDGSVLCDQDRQARPQSFTVFALLTSDLHKHRVELIEKQIPYKIFLEK